MSEEINNDDNDNNNNNEDSPNKKNITKRKRKELINDDSDEDGEDNQKNNNISQKKDEKSKEEENSDNTKKPNFVKIKFNTIDKNKAGNSPIKDNPALQEKLKKIFMKRDKLKFQYMKQDIPDSLKYHSDDSDSSDPSGLRKSKILKKNNMIFSEQNEKDKKDEINNSKKKHKSNSIKDNINDGSIHKNSSNVKNNKNDTEKIENTPNKKENIDYSHKKEENSKKIKVERKKFHSLNYNNKNNDYEIDKNQKSNKKIENIFNMEYFKNKNKKSNKEENEEEIYDLEKEEENYNNKRMRKDNAKKNILLKVLEKRDNKKDNEFPENKIPKHNEDNQEKEEEDNKNINQKQKLLKLLIEKKNNNSNDDNNLNKNNNDNEIKHKNEDKKIDNEEEEDDKEDTLKMKYDKEKENNRRKIIKQIKSESNNSTLNKKSEKKENKEEFEKNNKKEREKINEEVERDDENDEDESDKKGTYISQNHKNKLTINLKPKKDMIQEKRNENKKEINNEKEEDIDNNEEELKPNKNVDGLFDILEKLKQKKAAENKPKTISKKELNKDEEIDELQNEKKDIENIRKKEIKLEQKTITKGNKKIKEEESNKKSNKNNNLCYNNRRRISNKQIKKNVLNNEELKIRRKLEEDLKAEINKKDSNDLRDDEISTVYSKSNLINNSFSNNNLTQTKKEKQKHTNCKNIPARNTSNVGNRYKNLIDDSNGATEIMINDIPPTNLDRSFDAANAYIKRKVPKGKNVINVYRPKKVNNNVRNKSLIENSSKSFNPNQNIILNNANKIYNSPNYYRNNNSLNNNNRFLKNNHSFCEYPLDNSNPDSIRERNDINMEINLGGGLNSSFDTYMKANLSHLNKNNEGNIFIGKNNLYYGNMNKNFNNSAYNKKTNIPVRNNNYKKNTTNINTYIKNNYYKNEKGNKSFGYLNTGLNNNNNIFDNNNFNNNYNRITCNNNNGNFYGIKNQQFTPYNNNNKNSVINYNNIPLRTYGNQPIADISNYNYENIYQNSAESPKRYSSSKVNNTLNNINTPSNININNQNNFTYNNITPYQSNQTPTEKDTSINIEDILVLEDKFKDIDVSLKRNKQMHNECFEFWNYYYNCSLYGRLEKLFKNQGDSLNVKISINHLLMSVMICYDFSFEIHILKGDFSILEDILKSNHNNLIIIFEHILSKVSSESKSNTWVLKLGYLINNFNKLNNHNEYNIVKIREMTPVEKIQYNKTVIEQNIRILLKNYKTKRIEYLTSIFKKINDKTYDEINLFFRDNIFRTDNLSGSVLASVYLKENEYFQTEPAPYIKTKNTKPYSLILDLDETLIHFKVSNEDESEGILQIRPGIVPFLEQVGKYYELIVFTAATQDYGDLLIDSIEENTLYFEHRFYRQHTVIMGNDFVKDLTRIGRPLDKIIIVDNMPQNFRLQKENGINIKAFWGEDAEDNALEELGIILTNIAQEGGDLRIGLAKYRDEIIRKVTSNISRNKY